MDIPQFPGKWSYTQKEMTELFKHIDYKDDYAILEFGTGELKMENTPGKSFVL